MSVTKLRFTPVSRDSEDHCHVTEQCSEASRVYVSAKQLCYLPNSYYTEYQRY